MLPEKSSRFNSTKHWPAEIPDVLQRYGDKYKNYDFDYALKYSLDIADKYHFLKADYIVRKSTKEIAQAKLGKAPTKDTDKEKEIFGYYKHQY